MSDTTIQAPAPETAEDVAARLLVELEDEIKRDRGIFDLIHDGKAKIETQEQANAVGRAIVKAQADLERTRVLAEARIKRAEATLERLHYIFRGALTLWTQDALRGKKKRSIILEDAMLQLRAQGARVVTERDQELTQWVERDLPEALTYVPKVSLEAVKAWEARNGKLAPGRAEVGPTESLYVKVPKDKEE